MDFDSEFRRVRTAPQGAQQTHLLLQVIEKINSSATEGGGEQQQQQDLCTAFLLVNKQSAAAFRTFLSTVALCDGAHLLLAKSAALPELIALLQSQSQSQSDSKILVSFLELLCKALQSVPDEFLVNKLKTPAFIKFTEQQIASDDLALSDIASQVVVQTLGSAHIDGALLKEMVQSVFAAKLSDAHGSSSMLQLRYATVLAKIMGMGESQFLACLECGVVTNVLELCQTDDVLMQLCVLDLLTEISGSLAGIKHLYSCGIVNWLLELSGERADAPPADPFLSAQALTILNTLFTKTLEHWDDLSDIVSTTSLLPRLLQAITHKLEASDDGGRLSGLLALANFASSSLDSLNMVVNNQVVLGKWLSLLNNAKIDVKAACLHSIARVLDSNVTSVGASNTVFAASAENNPKTFLLDALGRTKNLPCVTFLVQMAKTPLDEMRHAAMEVLCAIANSGGWGLDLLYVSRSSASSGFRAFLENRCTEHCKLGKDLKFSIIQSIYSNPSFSLLAEDVKHSISRMISEGAYYMPTVVAVGIEDGGGM